jgi:hypothetical protein
VYFGVTVVDDATVNAPPIAVRRWRRSASVKSQPISTSSMWSVDFTASSFDVSASVCGSVFPVTPVMSSAVLAPPPSVTSP